MRRGVLIRLGGSPARDRDGRRRRYRKLTATALLAGVLALAGLGIAASAPTARAATAAPAAPAVPAVFAHAALASTEPADGSVVSKAPQQVSASFDQTVGIEANSLMVYSPGGQRVDDGQTIHLSTYEIAVSLLPSLSDGTYTVVWHVISADTHPVDGAFTFSIGAPSATHVGALLPASDPMVSDLFAVVRWLEYLCFALLGGGVAFLIICWPDGGTRQGVGRLIMASSLGLLLSTLLGLLLQGPYAAGTGLNQIFSPALVRTTLQGSLGPASEARELMALIAAGVASFLLPRLPAATLRARRAAGAAWAVLVTAIAASWAVYDHASTGVQTPWGIPDDIIHLDAVALWIGGLALLAGFALRPSETQGPPETGTAAVARAVPRFSAIALGCVITIVASGVYQTWREVGAWGALFDTTYGRLILAKIAGLIILIALGYLARRLIQHGLSPTALAGTALAAAGSLPLAPAEVGSAAGQGGPVAAGPVAIGTAPGNAATPGSHPDPGDPGWPGGEAGPPAGPGPAWAPAMRQLRRSVAVELAVAAVILAFTALLVNTATGREAYAPTVSASQQFSTGAPGGSGTVHVFAEPARLGPNTIEVYFTKPDGRAFIPAQVTAALYFPAENLGPLPVTLTSTVPGQYRTEDATVTFTGQWTLQIIVRSDAFDETSVTFPMTIH
jgi:copper transport protein